MTRNTYCIIYFIIAIKHNIFVLECRSKIKEKQTYIIQYETELQTVKFKSDSLSVNRMFSVKKKMDSLKKEVRMNSYSVGVS